MYWFAFALVLIFQPLGRTFFDAYGADVKSAIVYFIIDLLGLATLFSTPTLNPTWWYMTIAIIIIISIPLIMRLMERFGAFIIITAFLSILFLFGIYNAYVNYMFTILLGAACLKNDFFTRFISTPMDEDSKKRNRPVKAVKSIVSIAALFALLIVRITYIPSESLTGW